MRLVEIPDDGIVSEYIWAGDSVVGIRRMDLSYLPTIEAEPVRHGRWERTSDGAAYCTACKQKMNPSQYGYAFCGLCGAKMDLVEERHEPDEH